MYNKHKGMSVVEVLIALGVFSIVAGATISAYNFLHTRAISSLKVKDAVTAKNYVQSLFSNVDYCSSTLKGLDPTSPNNITTIKNSQDQSIFTIGEKKTLDRAHIISISTSNYNSTETLGGQLDVTVESEKISEQTTANLTETFSIFVKLFPPTSPTPNTIDLCASFIGEDFGQGSHWNLSSLGIPTVSSGPVFIGKHFPSPTSLQAGDLAISGSYSIQGKSYLKKRNEQILCIGPNECNHPQSILTPPTNRFFYAIGKGAADYSQTPGLYIGKRAGHHNTNGLDGDDHNIMIGSQAGEQASGRKNTFIGHQAGQTYQGNESVILGHETAKTSKGFGDTYIGSPTNFIGFDSSGTLSSGESSLPVTSIGNIQSFGSRLKVENDRLIGGVVNIGNPRPIDENTAVGAITNIGSSLHSKPTTYEYVTTVGHHAATGDSFRKSTLIGYAAAGACTDSSGNLTTSNTNRSVVINSGQTSMNNSCLPTFDDSISIHSYFASSNQFVSGTKTIAINLFNGHPAGTALTQVNRSILIGTPTYSGANPSTLNNYVNLHGYVSGQLNASNTHYDVTIGRHGDSNIFNVNTYSGTCTIDGNNDCLATLPLASLGCSIAGGLFCPSDKRWKENINPLERVSESLAKISGYSFSWIKNKKEQAFGVIAQEVQKVFPELVKRNKQSGFLMVDYSSLWAVLFQAVQEQKEELNQLDFICQASFEDSKIELGRQKKLLNELKILKKEAQQLLSKSNL